MLVIPVILIGLTTNAFAQDLPDSKIILENHPFGDFNLAAVGKNVHVVLTMTENNQSDVFLFTSKDGGSNFSKANKISNSVGIPRDPLIEISENHVYVVWSEDTEPNRQILGDVFLVKSSDYGNTFSKPISLSKEYHYSPETQNIHHDMEVVGKNVYVAWQSGQYDWIPIVFAFSNDAGKTFDTKRLSKDDSAKSKRPIVEAFGENVYVGWHHQRTDNSAYSGNIMITASNNKGQSFSAPNDLSLPAVRSSEQKILAFEENLVVVWRDDIKNKNISISSSTNVGNSFSEPEYITRGAWPELSGTNNIFLVVGCRGEQNLTQVCFLKNDGHGNKFSEPLQISNITWKKDPYAPAPFPKIASQGNTIYVVWQYPSENGEKYNWHLARSDDGGNSFTEPKVIGHSLQDPKLLVSQDKMYLLWADTQNDKRNLSLLSTFHPYSEKVWCDPDTEYVEGICEVGKTEKTKTVGDDAPFFGIFVYLENLISWILGK